MSNITGPMIALTSPLNDYVLQCNLTWTHLGDAITRTATLVNSWLPGAAPRGRFSPGIQEPIWLSLETFQRTIADLCIPNSYTEATLVTLASGGITDFATV
ncbi:MAG TPA: hypothetical protein VKP30_33710, partial [Polyangiaceae bacterium]|nr:hypothetical protein [Polyangiaceae bacterium]